MKKIFFALVLMVLVSACETVKGYLSSGKRQPSDIEASYDEVDGIIEEDVEQNEPPLSEGNTVDHEIESLYEVTSSDSLASIAKKYGTTRGVIIEMNDLEEPYILDAGTILRVPTIRTIEKANDFGAEELAKDNRRIIHIKPSPAKKK